MRLLISLAVLAALVAPARAQTAPTSGEYADAMGAMLNESMQRELALHVRLGAAQRQLAALTAERDQLKAAAAKPAAAAPPEPAPPTPPAPSSP
jgi:hypothetical protein